LVGVWQRLRGLPRDLPLKANIQLRDDGTTRIACGTQRHRYRYVHNSCAAAAEKSRCDARKVEVALGDTSLPEGPVSGGSMANLHRFFQQFLPRRDDRIKSLLTVATTSPVRLSKNAK